MKTMFVAAAAALLVLSGAANAQATGSKVPAVQASDATAPATGDRLSHAPSSFPKENPTGLPSYELRPDGLSMAA
jgi:hypothetical protein